MMFNNYFSTSIACIRFQLSSYRVKGTNRGHADSPVRDRSWFKSKAGRTKEFLLMLNEHWAIPCFMLVVWFG
jgi:hypothetical protein